MTIIINSTTPGVIAASSSIAVSDLLRRFRTVMMDPDAQRWSEAEAIDWINDAASEIVLRRPAARAVTEVIELEQGAFQNASKGTSQLLDVVRNIRADGSPDRAIRIADRQQIDDIEPNWYRRRAGLTRHYMIDERSPTTFYVYPPAVFGAQVEVLVAKPAPTIESATDTLDLRAEFINAILNWMMYRAHSKDSEFSQGGMATLHYQAFTDAIGAPSQAAQLNSATGNSK